MTTPIRVLQATAWYAPHHVGGTEIYVEGLSEGLSRHGIVSDIIMPRPPTAPEHWKHNGAHVSTYPSIGVAGPSSSLEAFADLLRARRPAIYHQHSWTPDCGADHLRIARELGLRTVLTVHVPSNTCMRGSMMRFGKAPCDGKLRETVCAACWAEGRGAPKPLAQALSLLPPVSMNVGGRLSTALSARALARQRKLDIAAMMEHSDRVVAVCRWLYDALALNDAPLGKLCLSRQGVAPDFVSRLARQRTRRAGPLRILYLGRWHRVKGLDTLVRALVTQPDLAAELVIHGVGTGSEERSYRAEIEGLAKGDDRISIRAPLTRDELPAAMQAFDVLAVPSTWLETGPLVVLEAQAAGLFVLGSHLGGIAELVDDPSAGRLLPAGDIAAWADALRDLAATPPPLSPRDVRSTQACADDMAALYATLS